MGGGPCLGPGGLAASQAMTPGAALVAVPPAVQRIKFRRLGLCVKRSAACLLPHDTSVLPCPPEKCDTFLQPRHM